MNIFQVIILSVIEGLTEFLPISSTGHLILTSQVLNVKSSDFVKSFAIFIQLGAIMAVLSVYFKTLIDKKDIWKKILIAFFPSGIIGFTFYKLIKKFLLGNSLVTVVSLIIGGVILIILEYFFQEKNRQVSNLSKISSKSALLIGIFQTISIIPGVSRAAATIMGGILAGLDRKTAVEFSFLLAVPTMIAATGLDLVKSSFFFTIQEILFLIIGFFGAYITAIIVIKYFLEFVKHHKLTVFGLYRIVVAILFWYIVGI